MSEPSREDQKNHTEAGSYQDVHECLCGACIASAFKRSTHTHTQSLMLKVAGKRQYHIMRQAHVPTSYNDRIHWSYQMVHVLPKLLYIGLYR